MIGASLAVGGEGAVHRIEGSAKFLAKLYHQPPSADRVAKLDILAGLPEVHRVRGVTAMPVAVLHDEHRPVGFVMPMAGDRAEVHHWFSPKDRKHRYPQATYDLIVNIARNMAACIDEIHAAGMVIGDVNERGFLIGIGKDNLGTVTAIDCDSFQVTGSDGRRFPCEVGIPEYLPPELVGQRLDHADRLPDHDRFGMAILIYKLLMMGRHPYMGQYPIELDDGVATAIAKGWYVHGPKAVAQGVRPPPASLPLDLVGGGVADLWMRAFTAMPAQRPAASTWVAALESVASDFVDCRVNKRHRHRRGQGACPWCAFATAHRIDYFPPPGSTQDVVFDLPVDQATSLVVSIRGWLLRLTPVTVPKPGPVEHPSSRFAEERMALEAQIGPLRAAAAQTRTYVAELAARSRTIEAWRHACETADELDRRRIQAWSDTEDRRQQEWVDAVFDIDRRDTEARRRFAIETQEYAEWLRSNRDGIVLTCVGMTLVIGLTMGLTKLGIITPSGWTIGLVMSGFIGLLIRQMVVRRRTKQRPPIEPQPIPRPARPEPTPAPQPTPRQPEPVFPDLTAPFHRNIHDMESSGMEQGRRIIGPRREQTATVAFKARSYVAEWESNTARELDVHVSELRILMNRLDEAVDAYRRLRVQHAEQMQVAKAAWDQEAMVVYLDSVQVTESRMWTNLGPNLFEALESFGVESALDVMNELVPGRIKVPGIGPRRTSSLEDWVRRDVIPRFNPSKYPLSASPKVQKLQRETMSTKSALEATIASTMERIPAIQANHDRLHAERSAQARTMAAPLRDALHDEEAANDVTQWWERTVREIVG